MRQHGWALAALLALTAIGFTHFPGHTWLQSDTQIYVPILERLWDPSVFSTDIIAQKPHVSFTIYDEAALGLRKLTGFPFRDVLAFQQILFRFCALLGVYLIALALNLTQPGAILVAACFGLGASIAGPSVLTFEYEPVPRGSAIGLIMLAIGLVAHRRYVWAGSAAAAAFLYHLPAVYPYWIAYAALGILPAAPAILHSRRKGLLPMAAGILLLLLLSRMQMGESEHQRFFTRIDAAHEQMMRERASYNWVSLWPAQVYWHHGILFSLLLAAAYRLRSRLPAELRFLALATSSIGMLSMPLSYLLLERLKWSIVPQIQPMRSLLYAAAFSVILCAAAAVAAAQKYRWPEAAAWMAAALLPPATTRALPYLLEWTPAYRRAALTALAASLLVTAALFAASRSKHAWPAFLAASLTLPFLIPAWSGVRNYPPLHHAELTDLIEWARSHTSPNAIFLFPDAEKSLHPGVFRAESLRTVYVDWKGGGQINFLREFLTTWRPRWRELMATPFLPSHLERYRPYGIDYIAVFSTHPVSGAQLIYSNARYHVYRVP